MNSNLQPLKRLVKDRPQIYASSEAVEKLRQIAQKEHLPLYLVTDRMIALGLALYEQIETDNAAEQQAIERFLVSNGVGKRKRLSRRISA